MKRTFKPTDDGQPFRHDRLDITGTLEFPLTDPGSALSGEGILHFDIGGICHWRYVAPAEVTPIRSKR